MLAHRGHHKVPVYQGDHAVRVSVRGVGAYKIATNRVGVQRLRRGR